MFVVIVAEASEEGVILVKFLWEVEEFLVFWVFNRGESCFHFAFFTGDEALSS